MPACCNVSVAMLCGAVLVFRPWFPIHDRTEEAAKVLEVPSVKLDVGRHDWPQLGGTSLRNNAPHGRNIPTDWDVKKGTNIKWTAKLGSQTWGHPVVANGKVFVATNNGSGYNKRFPPRIDLGCLLCFDEQTGEFLWQYSAEKLAAGRVNDWPYQGMVATPLVDGDRLWIVTNRCEVVCLDTEGFRDGANDGPFVEETHRGRHDADIVWKLDMINQLGVFPHNMSTCSVTTDGERLFVCTSNGVDATHVRIPSPDAPSFLCLDRRTGKVLWSDNSPGKNILHGQWASPTYFVAGNRPQVLFPGGDGWLYSFDPRGDGKGKSKLLWKFDCNPKTSVWKVGNFSSRRNICCSAACVHNGRVYIAVGEDPEFGDGDGVLWCINPLKNLDGGDVSPTLAVDKNGKRLPPRRHQAVDPQAGEKEVVNPDSAEIWRYTGEDRNGNGKVDLEETMHRTVSSPVVTDDLLVIADFSGILHCLDTRNGKPHWTHDVFSALWSAPLIVEGKVYVANEDGDVCIFPLTRDPKQALKTVNGEAKPALGAVYMENSIYTSPVVANHVLFVAGKNTLYAVSARGR